jgi:hypothetical protein
VRLVKRKGGRVRMRRMPLKRGTRGKGRGSSSGNRRSRHRSSGSRSGSRVRGVGMEGTQPGRGKSVVDVLIRLAAVAQVSGGSGKCSRLERRLVRAT